MTELETGANRPNSKTICGCHWMVRKVRNNGFTFDEFADELLKYVLTSSSDARRIDIVFDDFRETSIKNAERGPREVGRLQFKKILKGNTWSNGDPFCRVVKTKSS